MYKTDLAALALKRAKRVEKRIFSRPRDMTENGLYSARIYEALNAYGKDSVAVRIDQPDEHEPVSTAWIKLPTVPKWYRVSVDASYGEKPPPASDDTMILTLGECAGLLTATEGARLLAAALELATWNF
ncbi:hypothetical protein [Vulgatibacter incomptus]|uniref:hypothetical protein n=1 Tax=Vulgatibacter incomptus TaxID=1391653 RepID=UPI0012F9CE00|nr:hypothetical protein [Vulgatibacter incomptus]